MYADCIILEGRDYEYDEYGHPLSSYISNGIQFPIVFVHSIVEMDKRNSTPVIEDVSLYLQYPQRVCMKCEEPSCINPEHMMIVEIDKDGEFVRKEQVEFVKDFFHRGQIKRGYAVANLADIKKSVDEMSDSELDELIRTTRESRLKGPEKKRVIKEKKVQKKEKKKSVNKAQSLLSSMSREEKLALLKKMQGGG